MFEGGNISYFIAAYQTYWTNCFFSDSLKVAKTKSILSKQRQKMYFFKKLNLISTQFPALKVGESHILSKTHLSLRISKVFVIQLLILEFIMIVTNIYRGLLYVGWWSCKDLCKPVKESLRLWYLKFRSFKCLTPEPFKVSRRSLTYELLDSLQFCAKDIQIIPCVPGLS